MPSNDTLTELLAHRAMAIQSQLDDHLEKSWPGEDPLVLATALTYEIGALVVRFGRAENDQETTEAFLELVIQTLRAQVKMEMD